MPSVEAPSIEDLIPHRGDSILIDRVVAHDRDSTTVEVTVGGGRWLRREDGSVASWLAIEYMAQCIAAHEGMLAYADGRILQPGFLVSVNGLHLGPACFSANERLTVSARRVRGRSGLGVLSHACTIFAEGGGRNAESIAEGRLSIGLLRSNE
jgi:predicted hotdog family 3-hydroxylacyl-ACP dehydratase